MDFQFRHHARLQYPQKHVLICEDDLDQQIRFAQSMRRLFDPQGNVVFSFVSGGLHAAAVISAMTIDLIILDHDMPHGNGSDLLHWLKKTGREIPIITASGIPQNNDMMFGLGATHKFGKEDVIGGAADNVIRSVIGAIT